MRLMDRISDYHELKLNYLQRQFLEAQVTCEAESVYEVNA